MVKRQLAHLRKARPALVEHVKKQKLEEQLRINDDQTSDTDLKLKRKHLLRTPKLPKELH